MPPLLSCSSIHVLDLCICWLNEKETLSVLEHNHLKLLHCLFLLEKENIYEIVILL